jgi:hypothetical protein
MTVMLLTASRPLRLPARCRPLRLTKAALPQRRISKGLAQMHYEQCRLAGV